MCLSALLDCFLKRYMQQNKECKHHIKDKSEFFFAKSSKFGEVQMGHLHTCPQHLKLMPTTSLSRILHNEETILNTFEYFYYIFHSQLKKIAPKLFRLFDLNFPPVGCDLSCPLMHRY